MLPLRAFRSTSTPWTPARRLSRARSEIIITFALQVVPPRASAAPDQVFEAISRFETRTTPTL